MNIGIIGAGHIGHALAQLFTRANHNVALSNSRGPDTLHDIVAALGERAHAASVDEAAHFGEVVVIAIPFGHYPELPAAAFSGKVVVDANNYYPGRDGHFAELDNNSTTSSEMLSVHLPGVRVVKGFNTIQAQHLETQGDTSLPLNKRRAIFIAGDDSGAKAIVTTLIAEIGFGAVDMGLLNEGGQRQQPGTPVYGASLSVEEAQKVLSTTL